LISCNETNDVSLLKSSASSQLNFFDGWFRSVCNGYGESIVRELINCSG
jgi:hypothetical protein